MKSNRILLSLALFLTIVIVPAYGASKAGLNAMTQSLALALAGRGVYCFVVAPGYVETDMAAEALAHEDEEGRWVSRSILDSAD